MKVIELPTDISVSVRCVLRVGPPQPVYLPNTKLLADMKKTRLKQSVISQRRQKFITGMPMYRLTPGELQKKRDYIEEWHYRIAENCI